MKAIGDLIQQRRKACSTHIRCIPEDDTLMPTRVLILCGDDARPSIRLVESHGQEGRYIALSHCWGSTGKQLIRTTSKNLRAHQDSITFKDLPKTFQDVVELAQVIDIKHIWIDSLCILQDDHQDWLSEAAKMGDVYRNAAVVVAASGAKDSSEGLFTSNRPRTRIVRLTYRIAGDINGTFNMMELSGDWDPRIGPLERRAWTLQERYLARRLVTFMPNSVGWICQKSLRHKEEGVLYEFGQERDWLLLLRFYTTRSLTIPTDRTEAPRRIAEEFQCSRKDRYILDFGVWEDNLVIQLLW
ncbi:heterokaryon incompatibility protein-domain-containing protein [Alternaria rosae]|uniref:heterokaryon incompatibility protein-domain-containing protein n=1 Tax=Alternaria rosae TaxID=1187941 RepID=UPI001E8EB4EF|nr:heterokaryon incompatibility protein-domain-containing protein [Alternaria rosae]KAH6881267.1 heterokaryon incompatibility protein-domain-containing protein [Alternaria rosae]